MIVSPILNLSDKGFFLLKTQRIEAIAKPIAIAIKGLASDIKILSSNEYAWLLYRASTYNITRENIFLFVK